MVAAMSRIVTLVLIDRTGADLGALPPFEVDLPWWPEVGDVAAGARERYGVDVDVLRMLAAERPVPPGGAVTYLAEVAAPPSVPLSAATVDHTPHPLRAAYAEPGGPAASLAWATAALRRLGRGAPTAVAQRKTWNLSAIWRLDCPTGPVWLKQVPRFFVQEAAVLAWVNEFSPGAAPELIATDGAGRSLLGHVGGEDRHDAPAADRHAMAELLHGIQLRSLGAVDDLVARGVPDLRGDLMVDKVRTVVERHGAGIAGLSELVDELPDRLAALRSCGLPDSLVHGDFHPGNVRDGGDTGAGPVILDWGDAVIGNPGGDILGLTAGLSPADAAPLLRSWALRWAQAVPACDPAAALTLLPPIQALLGAVVYANFLAHIEPSEHPYHAADVPACLREAVTLAAGDPLAAGVG